MALDPRVCLPALVAGCALLGPAARAEDLKSLVNRCLARSTFVQIEGDGRVEVKGPDQTYRFNLKEAGINVNAENGDYRLRVVTASPFLRESFLCRDAVAAREAVAALRKHRQELLARDPRAGQLQRRIDTGDPALAFKTVGEALDFVNDRLSISPACGVDASGVLTLGGADGSYRVDLRKAEFSLNDRGERAKVRVYGDWAVEYRQSGRPTRFVARESFSTESTRETLEVVKALYFMKAAFTGQDRKAVLAQANVDPAFKPDPRTPQGMRDALNTKLTVSRIVELDAQGRMTVNAAEHVYRLDLGRCTIERTKPAENLKGWIQSKVNVQPEEGIVVRGPIRRFSDPQAYETVDEVTFACESYFDTQDALALLQELKGRLGKK